MYEDTDPQDGLFSLKNRLPGKVRERLKDSWAHGFAVKVMPILLEVEDRFAALYDDKTGRPCWSVARKLGLCILREWFDLADQEALDNLTYDIRWQHALGVEPSEAYLSRRSLVQFRSDLVEHDPDMELVEEVFERITDEALDEMGVEVEEQRVDSTQIVSNIQAKGRVWLFAETLMKFLGELCDQKPGCYRDLPEALIEWFERRTGEEGWFGGGANQQQAELEQLAEWLVEILARFEDSGDIVEWEAFELVERLVEEHCKIEEVESSASSESLGQQPCESEESDRSSDEGDRKAEPTDEQSEATEWRLVEGLRIEVRDEPINGGGSMQTPHDPDAGYGHKGVGYSVHLTETCNNESTELLTGWLVEPANENDWGTTPRLYESLDAADWKPDRMYADAGYPTTKSLVDARNRDSVLHAPVTKNQLPEEYTGREAFVFGENGEVQECPEGAEPVEHRRRKHGSRDEALLHAVMEAEDCEDCPLQQQCPSSHSHGDKWYVPVGDRLRLRDEALAAQRDPAWWEAYRIRSGIEASVSELKEPHGMGELRVRGQRRVELKVGLKMTACNIKRWLNDTETADSRQTAARSPFLFVQQRRQNRFSADQRRSRFSQPSRRHFRPSRPRAIRRRCRQSTTPHYCF